MDLRAVEGKHEVTWMTFEHKVREKTKPEGTPLVESRISRKSEVDRLTKGKGIQPGAENH